MFRDVSNDMCLGNHSLQLAQTVCSRFFRQSSQKSSAGLGIVENILQCTADSSLYRYISFCIFPVAVRARGDESHLSKFIAFWMPGNIIGLNMDGASASLRHLKAVPQQSKTGYICAAMDRIPIPRGFVRMRTSPGLAPLLVRIFDGWAKPETASP